MNPYRYYRALRRQIDAEMVKAPPHLLKRECEMLEAWLLVMRGGKERVAEAKAEAQRVEAKPGNEPHGELCFCNDCMGVRRFPMYVDGGGSVMAEVQ